MSLNLTLPIFSYCLLTKALLCSISTCKCVISVAGLVNAYSSIAFVVCADKGNQAILFALADESEYNPHP